jgi:hypothetical protein
VKRPGSVRIRVGGLLGLAGLVLLTACSPLWAPVPSPTVPVLVPVTGSETYTPFQPETDTPPATATATATPLPPSPTPLPAVLWISPAVPEALRQLASVSGIPQAPGADAATVRLDVAGSTVQSGSQISLWVYALVAPFPTVPDGVTLADLLNAWRGNRSGPFAGRPLWMDPATLAAFSAAWGQPASGAVATAPAGQLADQAWAERPSWAIVPFEALEPRWKVLSVDGQSPIHNDFDVNAYPLKLTFAVQPGAFPLLPTNRDPNKLTVLAMTGTTALVRGTADRMEHRGVLYPGLLVRDVLRSADLTHISNEIVFDPNCPTPDPWTESLRFCSSPTYIDLLKDVGTDIIEMTGNHLMDYGADDLDATITTYDAQGLMHYGGGRYLTEAQAPLKLTNHGNKLAFLGCNFAGPPVDWATDSTPGSAPCDFDKLAAQIAILKQDGYLPIVTFQYQEYYQSWPTVYEQQDFRRMADAGAVIVSGSQAHMPASMELYGNSFLHYGLGNLFFDQMSHLMPDGSVIYDTRNEFIDRQIFYDGRFLGTELLTYILEDYSQPRPMNGFERTKFLQDIFKAGGW